MDEFIGLFLMDWSPWYGTYVPVLLHLDCFSQVTPNGTTIIIFH
jgi:hypothetical protein